MFLAPHRTPSTSSFAFSSVSGLQRLLISKISCADPRERGCDGFSDPEPGTSYEPNRIVDNQTINEQEDVTCTEDNQITEIQGQVNSLSYNQSLSSSTQNSVESIATPQEADLEDEQICGLVASPR